MTVGAGQKKICMLFARNVHFLHILAAVPAKIGGLDEYAALYSV